MNEAIRFFCETVEIGAAAQIAAVGDKLRLPCSVVGVYKKQRLILSRPSDASFSKAGIFPDDYLKIDRPLMIQMAAGGYVFAFKSFLTGVYNTASKLLIVDIPADLTYRSLRKQARVPCAFPTKIEIDHETLQATTLDISLGGARVDIASEDMSRIQTAVNTGLSATIEILFPHSEQPEKFKGKLSNPSRRDTHSHEISLLFNKPPQGVKHYLEFTQMSLIDEPENSDLV